MDECSIPTRERTHTVVILRHFDMKPHVDAETRQLQKPAMASLTTFDARSWQISQEKPKVHSVLNLGKCATHHVPSIFAVQFPSHLGTTFERKFSFLPHFAHLHLQLLLRASSHYLRSNFSIFRVGLFHSAKTRWRSRHEIFFRLPLLSVELRLHYTRCLTHHTQRVSK